MLVHRATVTRGPWNFGGTISHSENKATLGPFRLREGSLFKDGQFRIQKGDFYGYEVPAGFDAYNTASREIGLRHGYIQFYGRNLTGFKQSRAARKRGYVSTDPFYNRKADRYATQFGR